MPTNQSMRNVVAKMKLIPVHELIEGKKLLFVDDSIVRGTQMRETVEFLYENGAKEVHMRISSPPFRYPCFFGTDVDSQDNLIACRLHSTDEIAAEIGADSLAYLSIRAAHSLAGENSCSFCDGCFTGQYPIEIPAGQGKSRFELPLPADCLPE